VAPKSPRLKRGGRSKAKEGNNGMGLISSGEEEKTGSIPPHPPKKTKKGGGGGGLPAEKRKGEEGDGSSIIPERTSLPDIPRGKEESFCKNSLRISALSAKMTGEMEREQIRLLAKEGFF